MLDHSGYDGYGNEMDTAAAVVDQHGYDGDFTDRVVQLDHTGWRGTIRRPGHGPRGTRSASTEASQPQRIRRRRPDQRTDPSGLWEFDVVIGKVKSSAPQAWRRANKDGYSLIFKKADNLILGWHSWREWLDGGNLQVSASADLNNEDAANYLANELYDEWVKAGRPDVALEEYYQKHPQARPYTVRGDAGQDPERGSGL